MRRTLLSFCYLAFAACGGGDSPTNPIDTTSNNNPPPVASVSLNTTTASLVPGQTTQLAVTLRDAANNVLTGRTISYSSAPDAVATVTPGGLVTAVVPGIALVTVASETKSATAAITVRDGGVTTSTGRVISAYGGKVILTIPSGALASSIPITISAVTSPIAHTRLAPGTAYDFGPDGTLFAAPATIDVKYDPALLPVGTVQSRLRLHKLIANAWTVVDGSTVNVATQTVTGQTSSFSTYGILELEPEPDPNPLPVLTSIVPSAAEEGGASFTLRAIGTGFIETSVIHWNGVARTTTFVSATELTATIAASDIAAAGNAQVRVFTPTPGGGTSASRVFAITPKPVPVVSPTIWSGDFHSCSLTVAGAAWCWGRNDQGQLGNNATEHAMTPVQVSGGHVFTSLALGGNHTCGITQAKLVYCWGYNFYGQIGDGSQTRRTVPMLISSAAQFDEITAGTNHTCGITTNGSSYCWGYNSYGQLGNGTEILRQTTPQLVLGGHTFTRIVAGDTHTCAINSNGAAFCWGLNIDGTLGDGTTTNRSTPSAVTGGMEFTSINVNHSPAPRTCALTKTGDAWCWGFDIAAEPTFFHPTPTLVPGGKKFTSITVGSDVACGTVVGGGVYCAGNNNRGGLGTGVDFVLSSIPLFVEGSSQLVSVASGYWHTCAIDNAGAAHCWGYGFYGSLGTTANSLVRTIPTNVSGTRDYVDMSAHTFQTCAIAAEGSPWCWGQSGQSVSSNNLLVPSAVPGGFPFETISTGAGTACATRVQGDARCWGGTNFYGQLGNGTNTHSFTPVAVTGGHQLNPITIGERHACGISNTLDAYCWGHNSQGQLGNGTTNASTVPVAVSGNLQFKSIVAGVDYTCGVTTSSAAYCWGLGANAQLGNGSTSNRMVPTLVAGGHAFESISGRWHNTCAVTTAGAAWCWGFNEYGELGNNSTSTSLTPVAVQGGLLFAAVEAGLHHTCGVTTNGDGYCWGRGYAGQLGNSSRARALTPQPVAGGHAFTRISPAASHTCAITVAQDALCWGLGGLLGNGSKDFFNAPVQVAGGHVFRKPD